MNYSLKNKNAEDFTSYSSKAEALIEKTKIIHQENLQYKAWVSEIELLNAKHSELNGNSKNNKGSINFIFLGFFQCINHPTNRLMHGFYHLIGFY